jgi:hypothetical protein
METLEPQEPPKLDEPTADEREMKLVELTHREWVRVGVGGVGADSEGDSDDVVVYGDRTGHKKRDRGGGGERSKKIGDRVGDTTGNDEEWENRKSKSSFFLFPRVKSCKIHFPGQM